MDKENKETVADVLVVGAGASGICAANHLTTAGKDVIVLEARERIGGRMSSVRTSKGTYVELGAQWLGKKGHKRLEALTEHHGFKKIPNYGGGKCVVWGRDDGQKKLLDGENPAGKTSFATKADQMWIMARVMGLGLSAKFDHPLQGFGYDANATVEEFIDKVAWTKEGSECFKSVLLQGLNRDLSEVALYSLAEFVKTTTSSANADEYYFDQGFTNLLQKYAEPIAGKIHLNCRVSQVNTTTADSIVITTTTGESFRAKHVIFAVPPQLLNTVHFTPMLPGARNVRMAESMVTGQVIKLIAVFPTPWWRKHGFRGSIARPKGPFYATSDLSHSNGNGVLVGFMNGPVAAQHHDLPLEQLRQLFSAHLQESFGCLDEPVEEIFYHDWVGDDLTLGGYVASVGPGQWQHHPNGFAPSVGNIHFAGTETAREWRGYIEGALEAGERAAHAVLSRSLDLD